MLPTNYEGKKHTFPSRYFSRGYIVLIGTRRTTEDALLAWFYRLSRPLLWYVAAKRMEILLLSTGLLIRRGRPKEGVLSR